ncbi:DUF3006 domain-containing protein [Paenibacillus pinistramenti]|uniref:DUF3006 domain-containing protein n=1 Tax=Paenibacillus pinistramenti TaxID=1768003 RepID=UPI001108DBEC|nr:DUF3006 domain-containing protein [Paenibacillus pinistramenti]
MDFAVLEGFEGQFAIVEIDGRTTNVDRKLVSTDAKQGDVLRWNGHNWIPDEKATAQRSCDMKKLMDEVWGD